jgi:hypothetical protein
MTFLGVPRGIQAVTYRCQLSFIPKKIPFNAKNYLDESKLLIPTPKFSQILTLANRQWVTYLHEEDARTEREMHDVPEHVLLDAEAGEMSHKTQEWAKKMLDRPGVVVVSITQEKDGGIRYFTIGQKDGSAFVWSN